MATLREQAKTSIPRVIRNSVSSLSGGQGANSLEAEKEKLELEQTNAVTKALSVVECPVKEKHVRTIIIGTFKQKSSRMFWQLVSSKAPLHGNPIVCWKFLHILHKIIREGHPAAVREAVKHKGLIEDLGKLWGHLKEGFGMLIALYCKLLVVKLDFHHKTPEFPGSLNVDKETLLRIGNNDAGQFYELCIEFLDYMDEILALERGVFSSLDMSKATSMTAGGQCRLAPLIVCIQDSAHLYDYTVKLLFLLHQHLPPDTLSGHSGRFLAQFDRLRKFYYNSSNLQYFKHLVQVPTLPATPPNFAVISELSRHVTPVAVVATEETEEEELADLAPDLPPLADERERYIDQLLSELEAVQRRLGREEEARAAAEQQLRVSEERVRGQEAMGRRLQAELETNLATIAALTGMVEEAQAVQGDKEKNKTLEEKFIKLKEVYQKLREEHIALLRQKAEVDKRAAAAEIGREEAVRGRAVVEERVEGMLGQLAELRVRAEEGEAEQRVTLHNLQAREGGLAGKLQEAENTARQREEAVGVLERRIAEAEVELARAREEAEGVRQNRSNVESELVEAQARWRGLEVTVEGQEAALGDLRAELASRESLLVAREAALRDLAAAREEREGEEREAGLAMLDELRGLEDMDSVTASSYSLQDLCRRLQAEGVVWGAPRQVGHRAALLWVLARGVANTCPDIDLADEVTARAEEVTAECRGLVAAGGIGPPPGAGLAALEQLAGRVLGSLGQQTDLAELVAQEIETMDRQIEEAAARIEALLEASRQKDTGAQLEVNESVLDSCTGLVAAVRELVNRSKALQKEIVEERAGAQGQTDREFYRKNSRWTEGLISAAKAVGLGAKLLVDAADKIVTGSGNFEEMMVASQEIAASTAQLVIASRVKAKEGSNKFNELRLASRVVTEATGKVVAVAKDRSATAENVELDFSQLSAHQSKTLEMETQVRLLKLESEVERERRRLAELRRRHYHGKEGAEQ